MVDIDTEFLYTKLLLRTYQIIGEQRVRIAQLEEVLNKDKKQEKSNARKS